MSVSNYGERRLLDLGVPNEVYVKLHIGDPGEDGTANAAAEATRKKVTLGAAATSLGFTSRTNTTAAEWPSVSTKEAYTHWSMWDAAGPAGGNCLWTGALDEEEKVSPEDEFRIKAEKLPVFLD